MTPIRLVFPALIALAVWPSVSFPQGSGQSDTTCVVAAIGQAPECFREPLPSILDDSTHSSGPRTYEFRGDGKVVPYTGR